MAKFTQKSKWEEQDMQKTAKGSKPRPWNCT